MSRGAPPVLRGSEAAAFRRTIFSGRPAGRDSIAAQLARLFGVSLLSAVVAMRL